MAEVTVIAPENVVVGGEFDVAIKVSTVVDFDAGQFDLIYNKTLMELVSVGNGEIGGTVIPLAVYNPNYSINSMRVVVNVPGIPGVSGEGTLAVVRFRALKSGACEIGVANGFINDNQAHEIVSTYTGDEVQFFRLGDANGDDRVDNLDVTYIGRIICGLTAPTLGADANRDGKVNTADMTTVEIMMES